MPDDAAKLDTPSRNTPTAPRDFSVLPGLVGHALPPRAKGYNRYRASARELEQLAASADVAMISAIDTVRVIGKLLLHTDAEELTGRDMEELADVLVTQAELAQALRNLKDAAEHGLPAEGGDHD